MCSAKFTFAALAPALGMAHFCSMEPILAERLIEKNMSKMQIGVFFCIFPVFYILCSLTMNCISLKIERRVRIIIAFILNFVAFLLIGPSLLLYLPDSLLIMSFGQALGGAMMAHILQPSLIEMVALAEERFPGHEYQVTNMSAALYNSF